MFFIFVQMFFYKSGSAIRDVAIWIPCEILVEPSETRMDSDGILVEPHWNPYEIPVEFLETQMESNGILLESF